jgi:hypothetical protein
MTIPQPVQVVLDLFASELSHVRFADIDGHALAELAAAVTDAQASALAAQAALDAAAVALDEKQEALLSAAHRALAYARVYAEGNDALKTKLDGVSLPRSRRARLEVVRSTDGARPHDSARGTVQDPFALFDDTTDGASTGPRRRGRPRKVSPPATSSAFVIDATSDAHADGAHEPPAESAVRTGSDPLGVGASPMAAVTG